MQFFRDFFRLERELGGWRFWLFWVVMTNVGFGPGAFLGGLVAGHVSPDFGTAADKIIQASVSALIIGALTGLTQGLVLNRHRLSGSAWALATTLGWAAGILFAGLIIFNINSAIQTNDFLRWIIPSGFIAGAVVGIPQAFVLDSQWPAKKLRWLITSAIGWGVLFPGMVTGYVLLRRIGTATPHEFQNSSQTESSR